MSASAGGTATDSSWTMGHRLSLVVFVALGALISTALLIEVKSAVLSSPGETLNHLFASGGFTLAVSGILLLFAPNRPGALVIMVAGTLITFALEIAQAFAPSRDAEIDDLLAGLAGVLLAAIVLEATMLLLAKRRALRLHVTAASITSIALLFLLMNNVAPGSIRTDSPDGVTCPLTEIDPAGTRFTIDESRMTGSCFMTESGGLGVVGKWSSEFPFRRAVLVTSELGELRSQLRHSHQLHIRAQVVTYEWKGNRRGVIALLRTNDGRHVVNVRANRHRLEVNGPNLTMPLQASAFSQALQPDARHTLDIVLTATDIRVSVDGTEVSHATMDPDWVDALEDEQLQLLIGNNAHRSTPFRGTIDWIEVSS